MAKPRVGPPGSQNSQNLPEMKNNMVSQPTLTSFTNYWKFVAPKTGYVIFDVCLSQTANFEQSLDNPVVSLSGFRTDTNASWEVVTQLGFDEFGDISQRDSYVINVIAGKEYRITVTPYELCNLVLRVSDYGTTRTGATPDLTFTIAGNGAGLNTDQLFRAAELSYPHAGDIFLDWAGDQSGHFNVQKTLLGPATCDVPAAIRCAWEHARKMAGYTYDYFYWGAEPGPRYPYYNPDYEVCYPPYPLEYGDYPYTPTGTFGYAYEGDGNSDFGLGYGNAQWWIEHLTARVSFKQIRQSLSHEGEWWLKDTYGQPDAYGSGLNGTGYQYVFGTNKVPGEVIEASFACDEIDDGGPNAQNYGPLRGLFNAALCGAGEGVDTSDTNLIFNYPYHEITDSSGATNRWWPKSLRQEREQVSRYSMWWEGGKPGDWWTVDQFDLVHAKALETETPTQPKRAEFGLFLSLIPPSGFEVPIPMADCLESANAGGLAWKRSGQVLLSRFKAEYPDWVITDYPAYPDSTMLGIGGGPKDSDRYFVGRK